MSSRSPNGGASRSHWIAWQPLQCPYGARAVRERRAQHLARVVRRAAHLRDVPVRPQVAPRASAGWTRSRPRRARPPGAQRLRPRSGRTPTPSTSAETGASWRSSIPARCAAARVLVDQPAPAVDDAHREPAPERASARRPRRPGARTSAGSGCPARASHATASPRVADEHRRHRRGRRARASPAPCRRGISRCRARGRSRRSARRPRRTSRTSSSPPCASRIAPAVKAELPPDHASSAPSRARAPTRPARRRRLRRGQARVARPHHDHIPLAHSGACTRCRPRYAADLWLGS